MPLEVHVDFPAQARWLAHEAIEGTVDSDELAAFLIFAATHIEQQADDLRIEKETSTALERLLRVTKTHLERTEAEFASWVADTIAPYAEQAETIQKRLKKGKS